MPAAAHGLGQPRVLGEEAVARGGGRRLRPGAPRPAPPPGSGRCRPASPGPSGTARSASVTYGAPRRRRRRRPTVSMPSAAAARTTRRAISPRLATRADARRHQCRTTPKPAVPATGAEWAAVRAIGQHRAGVARVDDPVVPQPAGGEQRRRLALRSGPRSPGAAPRRPPRRTGGRPPGGRVAPDDRQDAGQLLGPHHRDRWLGQVKTKRGVVGPPGHRVVAGAVARPHHQGEVRARSSWTRR